MRTYAHKKSSAPSFGVKLLVSLALLAISWCLVACTSEANPPPVPPPAPESVAKKSGSVTKTEFVETVNKDSKLKYNLTVDEIKARIGNLDDAIPNEAAPVQGSANQFTSYRKTDASNPDATTFHFSLPKGDKIDQYLVHAEPRLVAGSDAGIQAALKTVLSDTKEYVDSKATKTKEGTKPVIETLQELEKFLYGKFKLDGGKLVIGSGAPANSNASTLLFAPADVLNGIGVTVYLPRENIVEFLKDCANGRTRKQGSDDIEFMHKILGSLVNKPASGGNEKLWSEVLEASKKFFYEGDGILHISDPKYTTGKDTFDFKGLLNKTAEFKSGKVYITFEHVPDHLDYKGYLESVGQSAAISDATFGDIQKAFAALILAARKKETCDALLSEISTPAVTEEVSVSKADLQAAIQTILAGIQFDLDMQVSEIAFPDASFSFEGENVKFVDLPCKKEEAELDAGVVLAGFIAAIKGTVPVGSRSEVIAKFFEHFSAAELSKYSSTLNVVTPPPTPPADTDAGTSGGAGGAGGGGGADTSGGAGGAGGADTSGGGGGPEPQHEEPTTKDNKGTIILWSFGGAALVLLVGFLGWWAYVSQKQAKV